MCNLNYQLEHKGLLKDNTNKRSSAKATASAMSPFDPQDLAICISLLGCFASDCWGSCHGHSFETRLQTTFKYLSYEP